MIDRDHTAPDGEHSAEAYSARNALRRARAEFHKAEVFYEKVRRQATDRLKSVRETSVGEVVDGALDLVRRHPGTGLTIAVLLGFWLGRKFRR